MSVLRPDEQVIGNHLKNNVIDMQKYAQETEMVFVAEFVSKMIQTMHEYNHVVLRFREVRCGETNGFYKLLDELCNYWQWSSDQITIETTSWTHYHPKYKITHIAWNLQALLIDHIIDNIVPKPWNQQKLYGMFIGRANATRLRGLINHFKFPYKSRSLSSFHQDMSYYVDEKSLLEFLAHTNITYQEVINIAPYSDIDDLFVPPITNEKIFVSWESVYEQIPIELIFETNPYEESFGVSEKVLRPMLYKRPFLTVAGKNYNKNMANFFADAPLHNPTNDPELKDYLEYFKYKSKPFTCFDKHIQDFIGVDYDLGQGVYRVDHVFDILKRLIESGKINTLLNDWQEDIENNYQAVIEGLHLYAKITEKQKELFDYRDWS